MDKNLGANYLHFCLDYAELLPPDNPCDSKQRDFITRLKKSVNEANTIKRNTKIVLEGNQSQGLCFVYCIAYGAPIPSNENDTDFCEILEETIQAKYQAEVVTGDKKAKDFIIEWKNVQKRVYDFLHIMHNGKRLTSKYDGVDVIGNEYAKGDDILWDPGTHRVLKTSSLLMKIDNIVKKEITKVVTRVINNPPDEFRDGIANASFLLAAQYVLESKPPVSFLLSEDDNGIAPNLERKVTNYLANLTKRILKVMLEGKRIQSRYSGVTDLLGNPYKRGDEIYYLRGVGVLSVKHVAPLIALAVEYESHQAKDVVPDNGKVSHSSKKHERENGDEKLTEKIIGTHKVRYPTGWRKEISDRLRQKWDWLPEGLSLRIADYFLFQELSKFAEIQNLSHSQHILESASSASEKYIEKRLSYSVPVPGWQTHFKFIDDFEDDLQRSVVEACRLRQDRWKSRHHDADLIQSFAADSICRRLVHYAESPAEILDDKSFNDRVMAISHLVDIALSQERLRPCYGNLDFLGISYRRNTGECLCYKSNLPFKRGEQRWICFHFDSMPPEIKDIRTKRIQSARKQAIARKKKRLSGFLSQSGIDTQTSPFSDFFDFVAQINAEVSEIPLLWEFIRDGKKMKSLYSGKDVLNRPYSVGAPILYLRGRRKVLLIPENSLSKIVGIRRSKKKKAAIDEVIQKLEFNWQSNKNNRENVDSSAEHTITLHTVDSKGKGVPCLPTE